MIFYFLWIIVIIISVEIYSYLWHRLIAHTDLVKDIHNIHRSHHINENIEADEDFIW